MRWLCTGLWLLAGCASAPLDDDPANAPPRLLDEDFVLDPASVGAIGRLEQAVTSGDGANGAHVLFLNFDGATITRGSDNPALNRSFIPNSASTVIPPFDDSRFAAVYTRAAAITRVLEYANGFYAGYNVQIVTNRPASGRYSMMMVGGTATLVGSGGSVVGIAPLDCGNANESNVGYAFSASLITSNRTTVTSANNALRLLALTIVHEAGHSYGLEHVDNMADIMYPSVSPGQTSFAGSAGIAQPPRQCGSGSTQNTGGLLASNIGTRQGEPPDLGGGLADLGSGGVVDLGTAKDQGTTKDQGTVGDQGLRLADLAGDPGSGNDPQPTLDGGSGRGDKGGCGCVVASSDQAAPPIPLLLIGGLCFAWRRRARRA